jgi:hypothetical protein
MRRYWQHVGECNRSPCHGFLERHSPLQSVYIRFDRPQQVGFRERMLPAVQVDTVSSSIANGTPPKKYDSYAHHEP